MSQILIVDDEIGIRELLSEILQDEGHQVWVAENACEAREQRSKLQPDLVLLDIWMPDTDGISLLKEWATSGQLCMPVIMMSGHGTIDTAVEATRIGAFDFLEKPIALQKLLLTVSRALKRGDVPLDSTFTLLSLGKSDVVNDLKRRLEQLANVRLPLLLISEPGAGSEICARFLHKPNTHWSSPELNNKISEEPLELLQCSRDGLLFLDDIAMLNKNQQKGLLLILNKHEKYNVRIVCSSTKSISKLQQENFDSYLLNLLSRLVLVVPSLRDHKDDIPDLANLMLSKICEANQCKPRIFHANALLQLKNYDWPGNIVQLENIVKNLFLTSISEEISVEETKSLLNQHRSISDVIALPVSLDQPLRDARDAFERLYFEHHIQLENGNMSRVADKVGLERTHLYRKLKQLEIRVAKKAEE